MNEEQRPGGAKVGSNALVEATDFARALLRTRQMRNLGVRAAAAAVGVSAATYSRAENSKLPDVMTFRALCRWARLKPDWALNALDRPPGEPNAPASYHGSEVHNRLQAAVGLLHALDAAWNLTGGWIGNGCEHGFKPASACPNSGCKDAELHRQWNSLLQSSAMLSSGDTSPAVCYLDAGLGAALSIRLKMAAEGWYSEDRITRFGWRDGMGYSIWFERYDWHEQKTMKMTGSKACYHAHTPDLGKIADATRTAAERARRAWQEFQDVPPEQGLGGELVPGRVIAPIA